MTPEERVLEDVKDEIRKLSPEQQERIQLYRENIHGIAAKDPLMFMAVALVGAEMAAQ